ncbi:YifB family Mg chelatase-like AAA ATPase [Candidatus Fermentibacteria bacterium]|nr:YifB family Mg chelatase-like AAA ATPase [Candidatus Fermentibacteria bacterium]
MLARTRSLSLSGIEASMVEVEVSTSRGLPTFSMVGLPDSAVRESRQRVASAIGSIGLRLPGSKTTINLAPADRKKQGTGFDLPIAVSLLAAAGAVPPEGIRDMIFVGELSLDGSLRPVRGMLAMASGARGIDHAGLVVPSMSAGEASIAGHQRIYAARDLAQVVDLLNDGGLSPIRCRGAVDLLSQASAPRMDLSDVKGQENAKRALEVAAAGGHNTLMIGSPGSGKTMLARRLPGIMPPMVPDEAVMTTKVHSVAGLLRPGQPLVVRRPFRAPHHTVSDAGLIGGGSIPRPGEVSLATNGVLFLDELPEFRRSVLEVLRQPLEDGRVTISRASVSLTFPARFMLVAAMNPCPCGYYTDPRRSCSCSFSEIKAYLRRISGPLLDRIDIHMDVAPVSYDQLSAEASTGRGSTIARDRVTKAREIQSRRFEDVPGVYCNSQITPSMIKTYAPAGPDCRSLLRQAVAQYGLSARAYHRILKVAKTVADLEGEDRILARHVSEAIQYRTLDRDFWF